MDNGQLERVSVCLVFGLGCNGICIVGAMLRRFVILFHGVGTCVDKFLYAQDCYSIHRNFSTYTARYLSHT